MTGKKRCEIGSDKARKKAAIADWKKRQRGTKMRSAGNDPIGSLPAPPAPGSDTDIACGSKWMTAYYDAKAVAAEQVHLGELQVGMSLALKLPNGTQKTTLVNWFNQRIAAKAEQIRLMENALEQQVASYLECVQGMQT